MDRKVIREHLLDELQGLLDTVGAQPDRWPEERRGRLLAFIESDAEATEAFSAAKALDSVLAQAPGHGGLDALAKLEARVVAATNMVAQAPHHDQGRGRARHEHGSRGRRGTWPAASLLAASLVTGIFIGLSGKASPIIGTLGLLASPDTGTAAGIAGALFDAGAEQERL